MVNVSIKNLTRHKTPQLPFRTVVANILPNWNISLIFVGAKRARDLNMRLRKKSYVPNVLSYEVSNKFARRRTGEVFICLSESEKQAPSYSLTSSAYCLYLFIHALLHLKGLAHGAKMERSERKLLEKFLQWQARTKE